uniref:Glycoside hydrolase family 1 protein n=1 Tax=Thermosphaera aggregans TaxID=54254 RepID=A0A7C2FNM8_9CREN
MLKFPSGFMIGFSESGFQFEMGYPGFEDPNTDWWIWVHNQDNIMSGIVSGHLPENGPGYLALYKRDHDIAEKLGADVLRIGIEWSRVFPRPTREIPVSIDRDEEGVITSIDINENAYNRLKERADGRQVEKYKELFKDWVSRGKKLIINLNHFTLPSWIHEPIQVRTRGVESAPAGWLSDDTIVEFAKYAYYIVNELEEYADAWSTLNEPNAVATAGYLNTKSGFPPGIPSLEYTMRALRNQAIAHARAYDLIKRVSKKPVGIIYNFMWFEPLNPENDEDVKAASTASYMYNYAFTDTLIHGESLLVASESLQRRLDWIGVNYYTRMVVAGEKRGSGWRYIPGYGFTCTPGGVSKAERPCSEFGWEIYPEGLESVLVELFNKYRIPLIVTENGIADSTDKYRSSYLITHLISVLKAVGKGADVRGYLHWSLIDNYEWAMGFNMRFGLVKVDFETKKRYLRPSALVFREISTLREIPEELIFI